MRETYSSSRAGSCPKKNWSSGCLWELDLGAELAYYRCEGGAFSTLTFLSGRRRGVTLDHLDGGLPFPPDS